MEDTKTKFTLPNEKVVVKFIKRKKGMATNVGADHVISGGMLGGSKRGYQAPLMKNGSIANVLTKEEKEYLEEVTGLDLSVYKDFWTDYRVNLFKDDNLLDLNSPMDYISYKILLECRDDIAPTWADRFKKQTYDFVITSEHEENIENRQSFNKKKEAFILYGKIMDNKEKLLGVLKLLTNKPISSNTSIDWLQDEVGKILDAKPESFLNVLKDSSLDTKLLLNQAVEVGVVKKGGNKYTTVDGLDLAENNQTPTFENAIKYLDNPKYQDVRSLIEAKISNTK